MGNGDLAELLSHISHELRSPLTSIKGFSSTLVASWDQLPDKQRLHFVDVIRVDAERMSRMLSEVFDLARLETGRLQLNRVEVSLRHIITSAVERVGRLGSTDRVVVDADERVTAWGDPARLEDVVVRLLENALRFSEDGPVDVAARKLNGTVELRVRDYGVGIESERVAAIFEPPSQEAPRVAPSGTGVALYLSRRLVEAHGGSIEVETSPGAGSTFIVRLPAEQASP